MAPPPADIRSVARRAGVSIATVSRYLNGKKRLRPETERRIERAVSALGYTPNRVARSLRTSRTMTIGLIIPDTSNPFFAGVMKGAAETARAAGFALIALDSDEDRERERDNLNALQGLRCEGAILVPAPGGPDERARWAPLEGFSVPLVCVDRAVPLPVDAVVADNLNAGFEAVQHLVKLKHRRIALISVNYEVTSQRDRMAGYARALSAAKIRRRQGYEVRVPLTVDGGFSAASRLLTLRERPTAIFATSNSLTIGAVAAIRAQGLRCPEDVSIIGYDSYAWQEAFAPRLTTIEQPSRLMGLRSAELLLERILGRRKGAPETIVVPSKLIIRDSCLPAR